MLPFEYCWAANRDHISIDFQIHIANCKYRFQKLNKVQEAITGSSDILNMTIDNSYSRLFQEEMFRIHYDSHICIEILMTAFSVSNHSDKIDCPFLVKLDFEKSGKLVYPAVDYRVYLEYSPKMKISETFMYVDCEPISMREYMSLQQLLFMQEYVPTILYVSRIEEYIIKNRFVDQLFKGDYQFESIPRRDDVDEGNDIRDDPDDG